MIVRKIVLLEVIAFTEFRTAIEFAFHLIRHFRELETFECSTDVENSKPHQVVALFKNSGVFFWDVFCPWTFQLVFWMTSTVQEMRLFLNDYGHKKNLVSMKTAIFQQWQFQVIWQMCKRKHLILHFACPCDHFRTKILSTLKSKNSSDTKTEIGDQNWFFSRCVPGALCYFVNV